MSEINSIANGTYTIGQTSALNFEAGPGITIDQPTAGTVRIGNDETVLYSGVNAKTVNLTESWKNFDRLKVYVQNGSQDNGVTIVEIKPLERDGYTPYYNIIAGFSYATGSNGMIWQNIIGSAADTSLTNISAFGFQNNWNAGSVSTRSNRDNDLACIIKVVGINRISGGNE